MDWATNTAMNAASTIVATAAAHPTATKVAVASAVAAVGTPVVITLGVGALGFTATGIAAKTTAAWFMSTYGGTVLAGSLCALGQSIGVVGLGTAATVATGAVGAAAVGGGTAAVLAATQ